MPVVIDYANIKEIHGSLLARHENLLFTCFDFTSILVRSTCIDFYSSQFMLSVI